MVKVEQIVHTCMDGGEGLIALIARENGSSFRSETSFITNPQEQLQVAEITMEADKMIEPHLHRLVERRSVGTPEVLLVKSGKIQIDFYASSGAYITSRELMRGDLVVLLHGGHGIKALRYSEMIEVKQGPYAGSRSLDKDDVWKPKDFISEGAK